MRDELQLRGTRLSRRGLLKVLAMSAGASLVAACTSSSSSGGGTSASTPASAPPAGGAATAAPAVQSTGTATTVVWFAARDTTGYTPQQVDAFNKANKSIQIDYQEQGATTQDLHDKFVTVAGAKDSSVDIISMDVPYVPEFAAAGWTISVDEILPKDEQAKFSQGTLNGATYQGKLGGVPWFNNGPGLYYRKDLFAAKGLQPPKTYDDLLKAATTLQTADIVGFAMQLPQNEGGIINWMEYLWGYGGDLVDDKLNVLVDQGTAGVEGMQKIVDFVYKDKIIPEAALQFKLGADVMNLFRGGKAAMIRLWFSNVGDLYKDDSTIKTEQWDVAPLPSKDGAKPGPGCLGDWNLGVSKFSTKQKEALEAVRILTSFEFQRARFLDGGFLPSRQAVFDDPDIQKKYPYSKAAQASFENLKPRPVTPFYPDISANAIQPAFGQAMAKQITAQDSIKQMADKMRQILKSG
ncbi:MAG: ABC transporter substrate-binding protein [Chloroflexi bacterium]|nr:ABC transporter substrate-binding protein [Chloroflexota bacterium]MBV9898776.1 ABC transporter substrate-binding protein [Chloroflexota bacterium]